MTGFVGDELQHCELRLYTDADLAGCKLSKKSTSGVFLALVGPHTLFPLVATSSKQTAVSHASAESELVAADTGVKKEAFPMLDLWDLLSEKKLTLEVFQDNSAALEIIKTGKTQYATHCQTTWD